MSFGQIRFGQGKFDFEHEQMGQIRFDRRKLIFECEQMAKFVLIEES